MHNPMEFKIVTPHGIIYQDTVDKVTVPTEAGELTILPNHNVLISVLAPGEVDVHKGSDVVHLAISSGVLEMREDNALYLIADTAERAADIDIAKAEEARKKAEELLKRAGSDSNINIAHIQALIEKEMARISVGNRYKDVK